jgi:cytochrome c peroxidase
MPRLALVGFAAAALPACSRCPLQPSLDAQQCQALEGMQLPAAPPRSTTNAKADDTQAALLGFAIFFDARFSNGQTVRCANCHLPEQVFSDGQPTSTGLEQVDRNSPSVFGAAWHRWQTWDGKADSLWSQPLLALENPKEMDYTRLEISHRIFLGFKADYEGLFGPLPPLDDMVRFPPRGKPGDAAFDAMPEADQTAVNQVVANVGKSLEAYLRRDAYGPGRFDAFVGGKTDALQAEEREGAGVFFKARCDACHSGPTFSDDDFHVLGVPPAPGKEPERARAAALELLAKSPFTAGGPFSDDRSGAPLPPVTPATEGAYRTPSLRNVSRTAPYGHNGTFATLDEVVDFHLKGGGGTVDAKLAPVNLSSSERSSLLAFLKALDSGDPPLPWSFWPDR